MNIWNIDARQRQKCLTSAESFHFMSLLDKLFYLLDSIMLSSQIIATMISTVKCEMNNLHSTIKEILKCEFNWNRSEITPPCGAINTCILYDYVLTNMVFFRRSLLDTLMQIFVMLRHLLVEILRFQVDDYRVILTGASDIKLFVGGVCIHKINM